MPSMATTQIPSSENEMFMEKPVAEESVQQQPVPVQSDQQVPKLLHAPARDLWQDTLDQLPQSKRDKLKDMKVDNLNSTSIESDIEDLVKHQLANDDIICRHSSSVIVLSCRAVNAPPGQPFRRLLASAFSDMLHLSTRAGSRHRLDLHVGLTMQLPP